MKQKHKIYVLVLFILSLGVVGGALRITEITKCDYLKDGITYSDSSCYNFLDQKIQPVAIAFLTLFLISFFLFFVRRETFILWSKFAIVGFPLMLWALFDLANQPQSSGFGPVSMLDGAFFAFLIPFLFFLISLILIIYKSIKLRGKK